MTKQKAETRLVTRRERLIDPEVSGWVDLVLRKIYSWVEDQSVARPSAKQLIIFLNELLEAGQHTFRFKGRTAISHRLLKLGITNPRRSGEKEVAKSLETLRDRKSELPSAPTACPEAPATGLQWSPSVHNPIILDHYERSRSIARRQDLDVLFQELLRNLREANLPSVTGTHVHNYVSARRDVFGVWGMSVEELERRDRVTIERMLAKHKKEPFASRQSFLNAVNSGLPRRFTSTEGLTKRMSRLGYTIPVFPKTSKKEERPLTLGAWLDTVVATALGLKRVTGMRTLMEQLKRLYDREQASLSFEREEIGASAVSASLERVVWVEPREKQLNRTLKVGMRDAHTISPLINAGYELHAPHWVIRKKIEDDKGRTPTPDFQGETAERGINRIPFTLDLGDKEQPLPTTSFEKPYHVFAGTEGDKRIAALGSLMFGGPYAESMHHNFMRQVLDAAGRAGAHALVIGGRLMEINLRKVTGPGSLSRAFATDVRLTAKDVAEAYRDTAAAIIDDRRYGYGNGFANLYVTAQERFEALLNGMVKVFTTPDGSQQFPGEIIIVLSDDDYQNVIFPMVYYHLLYQMMLDNNRARAQKQLVSVAVANSESRLRSLERSLATQDLSKDPAREQAIQNEIAIEREVLREAREREAAAIDLETRSRMTNLEPVGSKILIERAVRYYIKRIEEVTGGTVIDRGIAHVRFGNHPEVVRVFTTGERSRNPFEDVVQQAGLEIRRNEFPDLVLVCSPREIYFRSASRTRYGDGEEQFPSPILSLPPLIDAGAARSDDRKGPSLKGVPFANVNDPYFLSGVCVFDLKRATGVQFQFMGSPWVRRVTTEIADPWTPSGDDYIAFMVANDPHYESPGQVYVRGGDGTPVPVGEAALSLLRSSAQEDGRCPVMGYWVLDDPRQGDQFGPSPFWASQAAVMAKMNRLIADGDWSGLRGLVVEQLAARPSPTLSLQTRALMEGLITPNLDVFASMLLTAHDHGISVTGAGRDTSTFPGLITLNSGNHTARKFRNSNEADNEGDIIAGTLRAHLMGHPTLEGVDPTWITSQVRGPQFQSISMGYGRIVVPGGHTYNLHLASTPPKRNGWADLVKGWVSVSRVLGNTTRVLGEGLGITTIYGCGDKHHMALTIVNGSVFFMGPCGTQTDAFSLIAGGLRESDTGVIVLMLPKQGPEHAPIYVRKLSVPLIQRYYASDTPFPWKEFLSPTL